MITFTKPQDFNPTLTVVACYIIVDDHMLLFQRKKDGKWCSPGGKRESGESIPQALLREVQEETNITLTLEQCKPLPVGFVTYPEYQFEFHPFICTLDEQFTPILDSKEHDDFKWVKVSQCTLEIMPTDQYYFSNFLHK